MDLCRDVPAAVWQQLGEAPGAFQKLRKASFDERLGEQSALLAAPYSCCMQNVRGFLRPCAFLLRGASMNAPRVRRALEGCCWP